MEMDRLGESFVYIKQYHKRPNTEGHGATRILYIPLVVVQAMGLKHRDLILFYLHDGNVIIKKAKSLSIL